MKRNIYRGIYANTVVLGGKIVIVGFDYAVTEFGSPDTILTALLTQHLAVVREG